MLDACKSTDLIFNATVANLAELQDSVRQLAELFERAKAQLFVSAASARAAGGGAPMGVPAGDGGDGAAANRAVAALLRVMQAGHICTGTGPTPAPAAPRVPRT